MKTKQEIVENWLPRYTERRLEDFTQHILLTNFTKYVELFAEHFGVPVLGLKATMPNAAAEGITIINFGMGSANAATIMDLLSAIAPKAVLFLGKCGGIKPTIELGDYLVPIGDVGRVSAARGAVAAGVLDAARHLVGHPRPREGLLDGDGLYDKPAGLGI